MTRDVPGSCKGLRRGEVLTCRHSRRLGVKPPLIDRSTTARGCPLARRPAPAAVAERLHCSPPTMANPGSILRPGHSRVFASGSRVRTMPLVGGLSRGYPVPPRPLHSDPAPYSSRFTRMGSRDLAHSSSKRLRLCKIDGSSNDCQSPFFGQSESEHNSDAPVDLLAFHPCELGSIPGRILPDFRMWESCRWVFSGISRFPRPFIPTLLHTHFNHQHRLPRPRCLEPPKSLHWLSDSQNWPSTRAHQIPGHGRQGDVISHWQKQLSDHNRGRGVVGARLFASHQGEPGSIPALPHTHLSLPSSALKTSHAPNIAKFTSTAIVRQRISLPDLEFYDPRSGRPGFEYSSGRPVFCFPRFLEIFPGECRDRSVPQGMVDSFLLPSLNNSQQDDENHKHQLRAMPVWATAHMKRVVAPPLSLPPSSASKAGNDVYARLHCPVYLRASSFCSWCYGYDLNPYPHKNPHLILDAGSMYLADWLTAVGHTHVDLPRLLVGCGKTSGPALQWPMSVHRLGIHVPDRRLVEEGLASGLARWLLQQVDAIPAVLVLLRGCVGGFIGGSCRWVKEGVCWLQRNNAGLAKERRGVGRTWRQIALLDSTVLCILEPQMFVHWVLLQRVASVIHHTRQYGTRYLFPYKSAIGSESSRACLINCDPTAKVSLVKTFWTLVANSYNCATAGSSVEALWRVKLCTAGHCVTRRGDEAYDACAILALSTPELQRFEHANTFNLKLQQVQEFPPNSAIFITLLVYFEVANRSAAVKRSSSKLLVKTVHLEGETTAIGTRSKTFPSSGGGRGGLAISTLASHQGEPGSIPGRATPDLRKWESCRTMPLVSGFSWVSPVSPALAFRRCSIFTSLHPHRLSRPRCLTGLPTKPAVANLKWRINVKRNSFPLPNGASVPCCCAFSRHATPVAPPGREVCITAVGGTSLSFITATGNYDFTPRASTKPLLLTGPLIPLTSLLHSVYDSLTSGSRTILVDSASSILPLAQLAPYVLPLPPPPNLYSTTTICTIPRPPLVPYLHYALKYPACTLMYPIFLSSLLLLPYLHAHIYPTTTFTRTLTPCPQVPCLDPLSLIPTLSQALYSFFHPTSIPTCTLPCAGDRALTVAATSVGNGRSSRKPAYQRHRQARFPLENPGLNRSGIEPGSPWREARSLTAQPPRSLQRRHASLGNTARSLTACCKFTAFQREVAHSDGSRAADGISRLPHRWQRTAEEPRSPLRRMLNSSYTYDTYPSRISAWPISKQAAIDRPSLASTPRPTSREGRRKWARGNTGIDLVPVHNGGQRSELGVSLLLQGEAGRFISAICRRSGSEHGESSAKCIAHFEGGRHDGNTARLARRSDETLEVRVSVARIAPSPLDLERAAAPHFLYSKLRGATVAERLARSPPTKANRVQFPAGSPGGSRAGQCRWPLGFFGDLPFPLPLHSVAAPSSLQSPASALKTSLLRAAQISSRIRSCGPQRLETKAIRQREVTVGVLVLPRCEGLCPSFSHFQSRRVSPGIWVSPLPVLAHFIAAAFVPSRRAYGITIPFFFSFFLLSCRADLLGPFRDARERDKPTTPGMNCVRLRDLYPRACHWRTRLKKPFAYTLPGGKGRRDKENLRVSFHANKSKIDVQNFCTKDTLGIGSQLVIQALDDSEPIADLQGNKYRVPHCRTCKEASPESRATWPDVRLALHWDSNQFIEIRGSKIHSVTRCNSHRLSSHYARSSSVGGDRPGTSPPLIPWAVSLANSSHPFASLRAAGWND
ncbi:hypothetical protein PR048_033601 [Dryococelus australis]|uniref:Uncharacterized protein n=1 Tax=Dryococelus australis TaxID=614101 RepID=A0ABQ9G0S2_9NEOP|nr:hypothetical protein PR048_033601 [Dryococelus australis]